MDSGPEQCVLCQTPEPAPFASTGGRDFFECSLCRLVQVAPAQRPEPDEERARYETHQNDPADTGYRAFLDRLASPLIAALPPGAQGLDFGAGPGPTLAVMLEEAGFRMASYDPFFAPDDTLLDRTYDFITCTETAEHFHDPGAECERLSDLLRPGGWLGIMTTMRDETRPFESWWYTRDPTHVCFYHPATMEWIARRFRWTLERPQPNVSLFRSPG